MFAFPALSYGASPLPIADLAEAGSAPPELADLAEAGAASPELADLAEAGAASAELAKSEGGPAWAGCCDGVVSSRRPKGISKATVLATSRYAFDWSSAFAVGVRLCFVLPTAWHNTPRDKTKDNSYNIC